MGNGPCIIMGIIASATASSRRSRPCTISSFDAPMEPRRRNASLGVHPRRSLRSSWNVRRYRHHQRADDPGFQSPPISYPSLHRGWPER